MSYRLNTMFACLFALIITAFSPVAPAGGLWDSIKQLGYGLIQDRNQINNRFLNNHMTSAMAYDHAYMIQENDAAFLTKLNAINNATSTIDMMYYIYSDDESSSVMTQALMNKAKSGVKVRLLVDYFTNYSNLDMFTMMESQGVDSAGNKNLQVRFYNRPTKALMQSLEYLVTGCETVSGAVTTQNPLGITTCTESKVNEISKRYKGLPSNTNTVSPLTSLILSGIYSKNPIPVLAALEKGKAVNKKELEKLQAGTGEPLDPEQVAGLKAVVKLYFDAKIKNSVLAKVKLGLALFLKGDEINPIIEVITSHLPVDLPFTDSEKKDLKHVTDFLHHKLLLADAGSSKSVMQIGGRNVENSYHMRPNSLIKKYIFRDTDLYFNLTAGSEHIAKSFAQLWDYRSLVADTSDVRIHAPNDLAVAAGNAGTECEESKSKDKDCVAKTIEKYMDVPLQKREVIALNKVNSNAKKYHNSEYAANKALFNIVVNNQDESVINTKNGGLTKLSPARVCKKGKCSAAKSYYIENLPYMNNVTPKVSVRRLGKLKRIKSRHRKYGAVNGSLQEYGKAIHKTWATALREVCWNSRNDGKARNVLIHQGYFAPTSALFFELGMITSGERKCPNVTIRIVTNSIDSTDLNVVNVLATSQMVSLNHFSKKVYGEAKGKKANFEYYEYTNANARSEKENRSLHTKVMIFDQKVYIGSANAEPRSLMMDTNNGALICHDPKLVSFYSQMIGQLLRDGEIKLVSTNNKALMHPSDDMFNMDRGELIEYQKASVDKIAEHFGVTEKLEKEDYDSLMIKVLETLDLAYGQTRSILKQPADQTGFNSREQDEEMGLIDNDRPQGLYKRNNFDDTFNLF